MSIQQLPGQQCEVTGDWLDRIGDDCGLTKGQEALLNKWCDGPLFVGRLIPEQVAYFLERCRGYRSKSCQDWST